MANQDINTITAANPQINKDPLDLRDFGPIKIFQMIGNGVKKLGGKSAIVLWSSMILLLLWGSKGNPSLIFPKTWRKSLFPDLEWRDQLVSYIVGFILIVVIPCCIIKFFFKESLAKYGLSWSKNKIKPGVISLLVLLVASLPLFYFGTLNEDVKKEYPLFGKFSTGHPFAGEFKIRTWGEFISYELLYLLFFINIEFIFRGYLLFGLYGVKKRSPVVKAPDDSGSLVFRFGVYAILIQMLLYTTWHIPKPFMEYIGAFFWGIAVTVIALRIRSIWPIIIAHWVLNVFMDTVLWLK
jgi:hypothetical protein